LHALLLVFAATRLHDAPAPSARSTASADIELDLDPLLDHADTSAPAPALGPTPSTDASRAAAAPAASPAPVALSADEAEPPSASDATATAPDGAEPADDGAADAPPSPGKPRLGLAQLGLVGPNQFVDRDSALGPELLPAPPGTSPRKRRNVKKSLEETFAQSKHQHDVELGLGAGSPVMRSLEAAVYASSVPLNGNAVFSFVIDSEGKLVSSSLGQVSSDRDKWERVAREAAQRLAAQKMRVPKGRGVKLTVEVTSHLELPSGRDPGVEVRALGIPLKKGGGPRSTVVDILNPLKATALALDGDPVDAAAHPRRMVRSHVVSEELL
jgi:hypothetical protein